MCVSNVPITGWTTHGNKPSVLHQWPEAVFVLLCVYQFPPVMCVFFYGVTVILQSYTRSWIKKHSCPKV